MPASVLAKEEARRAGADEALYVGPGQLVREGASSNVFAFVDGVLRTHPPGRRILAGITRKHVLSLAGRLGFPVLEEAVTLEELKTGEEVLVVSTTKDILPAVRIDANTVVDGRPGPLRVVSWRRVSSVVSRIIGNISSTNLRVRFTMYPLAKRGTT